MIAVSQHKQPTAPLGAVGCSYLFVANYKQDSPWLTAKNMLTLAKKVLTCS